MEDYMKKIVVEVLKDTGLAAIPTKTETNKPWFRAIGEVTLKNGTKTYAIIERDSVETMKIKKIYGDISPIHEIVKVMPYEFIDKIEIPQFSPNDKQNRLFYLKEKFPEADMSEYKDKTASELADIVRKIGINEAIKAMKEQHKLRKEA